MKRSNRLVMLVGVFLAVIAFVGVLVLSQGSNTPDPNAPPTEATVIVAREDIPLGTVIEADMVEPKVVAIDGAEADAFADVSQVIGQTARQEVVAGGQLTARTLSGGVAGQIVNIDVPEGQRAMSVLVDQVTGVGTLIKTGDYVDAVVRFEIQPTQENEETGAFEPVEGVDTTSTKLLLQGMQVIGVVLPPPPAAAEGEEPQPGTVLNNQQQLVILSVTPAQAEVLKYVEDTAGQSVSLILRSPTDFLDENGNPRLPESPCVTAPLPTPTPVPSGEPVPSETPAQYQGCSTTEGIVLNSLIFDYGVLVPPVTGGPVPVIPTAAPTQEPETSPTP